ncbi:phytoene/squalene synthase family protein [Microterricola pindariensis]|uniref:Phytoene synthase n=1 Tax=Microterricola pindariensis TaxID=478010 RepID=A0ABX5AXL1_9MICO|nr:squalene/phytoene synthase family protein [Microterricola pindariensis]PPL19632.1 phytoene synthase [Microterricola pindariensis]
MPALAGARELALYERAAHRGAAVVIREYSSSFGLASRLLAPQIRPEIENIYALVRVADEIVDGTAAAAGLSIAQQRECLDAMEAETVRALQRGYSSDLVVHAFALSARRAGITAELLSPFFASMRRDLDPAPFGAEELRDYIYGSAEVIGLMCLRVFLNGEYINDNERRRLEHGARRLGAAFQKINFLRDISADFTALGRRYFPGVDPLAITEEQKADIVAGIRADLFAADAVIPRLPASCRRAIRAASAFFAELTDRVDATPAAALAGQRVRVPGPHKVRILAGVLLRSR